MSAGDAISIGILAILFAGYCYVAHLLAKSRHDRSDDIAEGDCFPVIPTINPPRGD